MFVTVDGEDSAMESFQGGHKMAYILSLGKGK
jgi:hypothetical protein